MTPLSPMTGPLRGRFQWCLGFSWSLLFLRLKNRSFGCLSPSLRRPRSPSLLLLLISVDCCCHSHHFSSPLSFPALPSHSISAVFSFLSSVLLQGLPALVWRHWAYKHVAGQLNSTFLSCNWSSQLHSPSGATCGYSCLRWTWWYWVLRKGHNFFFCFFLDTFYCGAIPEAQIF